MCAMTAACPEWGAKGQGITAEDRAAAPIHVFSELTQAEYDAGTTAVRSDITPSDEQRAVSSHGRAQRAHSVGGIHLPAQQ